MPQSQVKNTKVLFFYDNLMYNSRENEIYNTNIFQLLLKFYFWCFCK